MTDSNTSATAPSPEYQREILTKAAALVTCGLSDDPTGMAELLVPVNSKKEFIDLVAVLALTMGEVVKALALLKGITPETAWQDLCLDLAQGLEANGA